MVKATEATNEQLEISIPEAAHRLAAVYVPRARIHPDPGQPRVDADDELRASIAREGLLQPVLIRTHPTIIGDFMLIDGERRWRGAEGVLEDLPVILRDDKDTEFARLVAQLIANSGKPLTPMEEARAYQRLMDAQPTLSLADLAKITGKPRSTIGDRLSLLQLGPWVPLIEAGKLPISFATRFIVPFKGVPDRFHAPIAEHFLKCLGDDREMEAADFERDVCSQFDELLYALTKIKGSHQGPLFDTKSHDQECDCGRIQAEDSFLGKQRDYCGNPDWWTPLDKAAKKDLRAKEKKDAPLRKAASRPQGPVYQLPIDAGKPIDTGYNPPPKGVIQLSDKDGHWKVERNRVMSDEFFDPSTVEIRDKNLVLLKSDYNGSRIGTRDDAAIAVARKAWRASRTELLEGARDQLSLVFKKKGATAAVEGKGSGVLLAVLVSARGFANVAGVSLLDAATVAKVPLPPKGAYEGHATETAARKWADSLTDKQAAAVLSVIALVNSDAKVNWPHAEVEQTLERKADAIAKKNVPWLASGKAAKGGKATDSDEADREADDE